MAQPKYGDFDGIASRYDDREAWVLHKAGWVEINRISHGNAVRELTKDQFDQLYPDVPALPADAFKA